MKNKSINFISILIAITFLWQGALWARPDSYNCLRAIAAAERMPQARMPGTREEGAIAAKERLRRIDFRREDYYLTLGDMDRLSTLNRVYSKGIIGTLGRSSDPDVIFSKHSLFREILSTLAGEAAGPQDEGREGQGLDVYRYLAGDEFVPQGNLAGPDTTGGRLNTFKDRFRRHFEDRYMVVKVRALRADEQEFLNSRDDVLAVVRRGRGYRVLIKRDTKVAPSEQLAGLNRHMRENHDLAPIGFNGGIIPPLSVSVGAISAKGIIKAIEETDGVSVLDENGHIREAYIDQVYDLGMKGANDMLKNAKMTRNTVFVGDTMTREKLAEHRKPKRQVQAASTARFYDQNHFRRGIKANLVFVEVVTYNGIPSREEGGFHALNTALGYDAADEVIEIMSEVIARAVENTDAICCLDRPDKFFLSLGRDASPDFLSDIITSIKLEAERRLTERFGRRFPFDMRFKVSVASSGEVSNSRIPEFQNIFRVIDAVSKLEKTVEMTSATQERPQAGPQAAQEAVIDRAVIHRNIDGVGDIRIYSSSRDKEKLLIRKYRTIQEKEEEEGIMDATIANMGELQASGPTAQEERMALSAI